MNDDRRKQIREALDQLGAAKTTLEIVRDEEAEALESMPESLQNSEQGEKMTAAGDALEEAIDSLETITDALENL